jgi:hypothetical protein
MLRCGWARDSTAESVEDLQAWRSRPLAEAWRRRCDGAPRGVRAIRPKWTIDRLCALFEYIWG